MEIKSRIKPLLLVGWILVTIACSLLKPEAQSVTTQSVNPTATLFRKPTLYPTPTELILRGTVRIWHAWNETERTALAQIIKGFNENYPDVFFDVLYVPAEDIQARFEFETREGTGPTMLLGPAEWGPSFYNAGLIKNLASVLDHSITSRINQPALEACKYKDALIGLPYTIQGIVLYRNKEIVSLNPKTLDELVLLARTSTQGEDVGAILERSFFYSGAHLNGIGGQWMDLNGLPAFNNEKSLAWIELLKTFEQAGPVNFFTDQDVEYFKDGRVGWIIDSTWNMQTLDEAIGHGNLVIDPWPTYETGQLSGFVIPENLYISNITEGENLAVAQKFVQYFLSPEAQTWLVEVSRIPAINDLQFTDSETDPLIIQAMTALAGGTAYPSLPEMAIYSLNMDIALRAIFEQDVPSSEALQSAEEAILAALQQNLVTPSP